MSDNTDFFLIFDADVSIRTELYDGSSGVSTIMYPQKQGPLILLPPVPEADPGQGVMTKTHPDGTRKAWSPEAWKDKRWVTLGLYDKSPEPNLICSCGSEDFKVCWWDYPYSGGYLRLMCSACGEATLVMDDYS